jgi:phosphoglycolate phosphatase
MGLGPVGFDLDMTLIDSRPAIMAAFAAMSRDLSVRIDLDAVDGRLGVKLEDELGYWFPPDGIAEAAGCYRRHYVRLAAEKTSALPGAREALAAVRAAGERAVIITAKHPVSVGPSLRAAGLTADELFTHVHGPEKAEVLRRLGAAGYVGDTPPDIAAGISAGVRAVGVATGSFTAAQLRQAGAEPVLGTLEAFPAWYQGLGPAGRGARLPPGHNPHAERRRAD